MTTNIDTRDNDYPQNDERKGRPGRRYDDMLPMLADHVLEEAFQAWLQAATTPSNLQNHRQHLRRRIEAMVERAGYGNPAHIVDLTRLT